MHKHDLECAIEREARLEGITVDEAIRRQQIRDAHYIEQIGWVVHAITDMPAAHTHGLEESRGHLDFEVWLPTTPQKQYQLLRALAEAVMNGHRFEAEQEDNTVFTVPVRFVERQETGRTVLRAIFPDVNGKWPGEMGCESGYNEQLN